MRVRSFAVLGLQALTFWACAHVSTPQREGDRESLLAQQSAFLAALSARDLEQTLAHFAPDAVLHVAIFPAVRGEAAIRQFYGNVFRFLTESTATPDTTRVSAGSDMAFSLGTVRNVFSGEQGRQEHTGKFSLVWERRAGEWRIVLYTLSSDRSADGR
jgi:ketosteroid isomerase-like protein